MIDENFPLLVSDLGVLKFYGFEVFPVVANEDVHLNFRERMVLIKERNT